MPRKSLEFREIVRKHPEIFLALAEAYPNGLLQKDIAKRAGKTASNFSHLKYRHSTIFNEFFKIKIDRRIFLRSSKENFIRLAKEFLSSDWAPNIIFFRSNYTRSGITPSLLREIEKLWRVKEPFPDKATIEKAQSKYDIWKEAEKQPETETEIDYKGRKIKVPIKQGGIKGPPYWNSGFLEFFTEEDVLQILKFSPTALQKALKGPSHEGQSTFTEMLLSSLLLDFNTFSYPGYTIKPTIEVQVYEQGEEKPMLHKAAGIPTYHPPPPLSEEALTHLLRETSPEK